MKLLFENQVCSRCHGTGEYSFCQMYGTRCFKCAGAKVVLTKRGKIAQDYLVQLQTIPLQDLKPGQIIECTGYTNGGAMFHYKAPVISIEPSNSATINGIPVEYICIKTEHLKYGNSGTNCPRVGTIRVWPNTPENVAKALEFQATLTKSGTVKKQKKS